MDLAATCAALLHLMGLAGRAEEQAPAGQDPADMGTAYGLEASLAPISSALPSSKSHPGSETPDYYAWLRPR
jgi:hypothetical protein